MKLLYLLSELNHAFTTFWDIFKGDQDSLLSWLNSIKGYSVEYPLGFLPIGILLEALVISPFLGSIFTFVNTLSFVEAY